MIHEKKVFRNIEIGISLIFNNFTFKKINYETSINPPPFYLILWRWNNLKIPRTLEKGGLSPKMAWLRPRMSGMGWIRTKYINSLHSA